MKKKRSAAQMAAFKKMRAGLTRYHRLKNPAKSKRKMSSSAARSLFNRVYAQRQSAEEQYLRSDKGNAERLARNKARLKNPARPASGVPKHRSVALVIRKGKQQLHYDGTNFSKFKPARRFRNREAALIVARSLAKRYHSALKGWRWFVSPR